MKERDIPHSSKQKYYRIITIWTLVAEESNPYAEMQAGSSVGSRMAARRRTYVIGLLLNSGLDHIVQFFSSTWTTLLPRVNSIYWTNAAVIMLYCLGQGSRTFFTPRVTKYNIPLTGKSVGQILVTRILIELILVTNINRKDPCNWNIYRTDPGDPNIHRTNPSDPNINNDHSWCPECL